MSVREEDGQKNGCSSRGLGIAAAAIGVGVGAALYYFFSKREEHPATEGATSHNWGSRPSGTLQELRELSEEHSTSDDSYITISENTTSDTSILEDDSLQQLSDEEYTVRDSNDSDDSNTDDVISVTNSSTDSNSPRHWPYISEVNLNDSDGWEDVSTSSWIPSVEETTSTPLRRFVNSLVSPRLRRSRERSWSLEECSICFEVILRNQEVMSLPCTHHFHQACILPWLQEQQTCPNCRKAVD